MANNFYKKNIKIIFLAMCNTIEFLLKKNLQKEIITTTTYYSIKFSNFFKRLNVANEIKNQIARLPLSGTFLWQWPKM